MHNSASHSTNTLPNISLLIDGLPFGSCPVLIWSAFLFLGCKTIFFVADQTLHIVLSLLHNLQSILPSDLAVLLCWLYVYSLPKICFNFKQRLPDSSLSHKYELLLCYTIQSFAKRTTPSDSFMWLHFRCINNATFVCRLVLSVYLNPTCVIVFVTSHHSLWFRTSVK